MLKRKKIKNVESILNLKSFNLIAVFVRQDSEILLELRRHRGDKVNEYIFFKDLSSRNEKNKTLYSEFDIKSRPWTKCKHKIAGYASVIYIYSREKER